MEYNVCVEDCLEVVFGGAGVSLTCCAAGRLASSRAGASSLGTPDALGFLVFFSMRLCNSAMTLERSSPPGVSRWSSAIRFRIDLIPAFIIAHLERGCGGDSSQTSHFVVSVVALSLVPSG